MDAHFFVAVLGYSGYPYVEAFPDERVVSWITAHVNALRFYGGTPRKIVPDNCKTAVKTPQYYEPTMNMVYGDLGRHYELAIVPTRIKKPKDKPFIEKRVGWVETWLLGELRNQTFFDFHELNIEIRRIMNKLVDREFKKRKGVTRRSLFKEFDQPALRPLPEHDFEIADTVARKVGDNYHLEYDGFHYSVPYTLHQEQVTLRATTKTIEVLDKNRIRVATHPRKFQGQRYISLPEHMPKNHQAVYQRRQFDGSRYRNWAKNIGENTHTVIDNMLQSGPIEEQAYRSCMGVLQFGKTYGNDRLESACAKAIELGSYAYTTIKNILKNRQDGLRQTAKPSPEHENIRGSGYYE